MTIPPSFFSGDSPHVSERLRYFDRLLRHFTGYANYRCSAVFGVKFLRVKMLFIAQCSLFRKLLLCSSSYSYFNPLLTMKV